MEAHFLLGAVESFYALTETKPIIRFLGGSTVSNIVLVMILKLIRKL